MKPLLLFLISTSFCFSLQGQQTPQYSMVTSQPLIQSAAPFGGGNNGHQTQTLYYPSEFPGATAGYITRLYVKAAFDITTTYYHSNFLISMGYKHQQIGEDTMCFKSMSSFNQYSVDTVLFALMYTMSAPIYANTWVPFTLTKPFYYNGVSNFIIDTKPGFHSTPLYFLYPLALSNPSTTCGRSQTRNSSSSQFSYTDIFIVGFDITPTTVNSVETQFDIQLYPNPTHGNVNINFKTQNRIEDLAITITNISGNTISQQHYQNITGNFSKQIDLTGMAKGLYFVEIKGDKEKLVRKLVLQ